MEPVLRKGDSIEVASPDHLRIGDLIVFQSEGQLVCHRIRKILEDGRVETQGDASSFPDARLKIESIFGKVRKIHRVMRIPGFSWIRKFESPVRQVIEILKRNSVLNPFLRTILSSQVRFFLAHRSVKSLEGYEDWELREGNFLAAEAAGSEMLLVARFKNSWLASLHLGSQKLQIRRLVSGLGIEETLKTIAKDLESCLSLQSKSAI